jgi:hypothetical protein
MDNGIYCGEAGIGYNNTFKKFLKEFNLPNELSFSIDIPAEVNKILIRTFN